MRPRDAILLLAAWLGACSSKSTASTPVPPATPDRLVYAVEAPGRTSLEVDRDIGAVVERALTGAPGISRAEVVSRAGYASAHCLLAPGTSASSLRGTLLTKLLAALVPTGTTATPIRAGSSRPLALTLQVPAADPLALARWQGAAIPSLLTVPAVQGLETCGTTRAEVRVVVDPARLQARGLGLDPVIAAVRGQFPSVEAVGERDVGGVPQVLLRELATVSLDAAEPVCRALRDGAPVLLVTTRVTPEADLTQLRALVGARLVSSGAPPGVRMEVLSPSGPVTLVSLQLPEGTTWEAAARNAETATAAARGVAGIGHVIARIGGSDQMSAGPRQTDLEIELPPTATDAAARILIERSLVTALSAIPGVQVRVPEGALPEHTVRVIGDDLDALTGVARALVDRLRATPGVQAAGSSELGRVDSLSVSVDPAAAEMPMEPAAAERAVLAATVGVVTGVLVDGQSRRDIRVRLGTAAAATTEQLQSLAIPIRGGVVTLSQVGRLETKSIPDLIVREGGHRQIRVWLRLVDESSFGGVRGVVGAALPLPAGVTLDWE